MHIEEFRELCLALPHTTESMPFGDGALVFKVYDKMFALIFLPKQPPYVSLKCDPDWAIELRQRYDSVEPAYHLNKKHWNGITLTGDCPREEIIHMLHHSYELVWSKLPKRYRQPLP